MTQKKYAFGYSRVKNYDCPARAAGYSPEKPDESRAAADWFDTVVKHHSQSMGWDSSWHLLPEEDAKEAWLMALDEMEYEADPAVYEIAKDIAQKIGWL